MRPIENQRVSCTVGGDFLRVGVMVNMRSVLNTGLVGAMLYLGVYDQ